MKSQCETKTTTKSMGIWGHWSISSLYFFAFYFCFYPPPGSSPFLLSTLSYATSLSQSSSHPPKSPHIPVHPCTFPHIPASTQQLAMACLPKREQLKYSLQGFPSASPRGNLLLTKAPCWPQESNSGRRAGALPVAQTNTTYCNPLLPPVLIQYRPSWVTRHFEDLTFSHYLSFT